MNLNGTIKKTQALSGRLVKSSGGGGSVQEIYWVQYGVGTATNAEVNEAVAANKLPICYWDSTDAYGRPRRTLYFLVRHTPTEAFFATVLPTTQIIEVKRLYADAFYTEIIRYEGKLTWDTTPRFGSVNPVTSGGIYNAIQNATVSDERIAEAVDDWLSVQAPSIGTLSYAAKQALLACFRHVAWIDDQGQSYYNALESELFPDATLESITAVFTQGSAVIYDTDSLDTLRQYLTVTATFSDSTTAIVSDYTLSGTLTAGTSTITVSYGGQTDTFNVTVTEVLYSLFDTTFNSESLEINTGLSLLENDRDITFAYDIDLNGNQPNNWKIFVLMNATSPWAGVNTQRVSTTNANGQITLMTNTSTRISGMSDSYVGKLRVVITHSIGNTWNYWYRLGTSNVVSGSVTSTFQSVTNTLRIGASSANSKINATYNSFIVYPSVISNDRITDFLE